MKTPWSSHPDHRPGVVSFAVAFFAMALIAHTPLAALSGTAPAAPSELTASSIHPTNAEVKLTWKDNANNEVAFVLERRHADEEFELFQFLPENSTAFTDTQVSGIHQPWSYRIYAYNNDGGSGYSNELNIVTPNLKPPSNLTAVAGSSNATVTLNWRDNADNESAIVVERRRGTEDYVRFGGLPVNTTTFKDAQAVGVSETYTYRVRAVFGYGESADSNLRTITTPALMSPTELTAVADPSKAEVNLNWRDNSSNESSMIIERKKGSGQFEFVRSLPLNTSHFTDTQVRGLGVAYTYRVSANNRYGSTYSNEPTITTPTLASPSDVKAVADTENREIRLTWKSLSNNALGFIVERRYASQELSRLFSSKSTEAIDTIYLSPSTQYRYRVSASNGYGASLPSDSITLTTPGPPPAPRSLTAVVTAIRLPQITLNWNPDTTLRTQKYRIEFRFTTFDYRTLATTSADVVSYVHAPFERNLLFTYRVIAVNGWGDSPPSNEASATVPEIYEVFDIAPSRASNTRPVEIRIAGSGIPSGSAKIILRGAKVPELRAFNVSVLSDAAISASLNLKGAPPGVRDVIVQVSDGREATLHGAFTVETQGTSDEPHLWAEVIGRGFLRRDRFARYQIVVGNSGNSSWKGLSALSVWVPTDTAKVTVRYHNELVGEFVPKPAIALASERLGFDPSRLFAVNLTIPYLPPASQVSYEVSFTAGRLSTGGITAGIVALPPPTIGSSIHQFYQAKGKELNLEVPSESEAFKKAFEKILDEYISKQLQEFTIDAVGNIATAVFGEFVGKTIEKALEMLRMAYEEARRLEELMRALRQQENSDFLNAALFPNYKKIAPDTSFVVDKPIQYVFSIDPNEKTGSVGTGESRYVSSTSPLRYGILFENVSSATAPAQEVVIQDRLDPLLYDLQSFSPALVAFGDSRIGPPDGSHHWAGLVDLRPKANLVVRVTIDLDKDTGIVVWRLISLDPNTGQLPEDPNAGLLPPNTDPPAGEGLVLFTVRPREGLPNGTFIRNRASIIFDSNPAIETNEWVNTLDLLPPQSAIAPLPSTTVKPTFTVSWAGTDADSGVRDYTIWVSDNGGEYSPWLRNVTNTSAEFCGQPDHQYRFYSIASDAVANSELAPEIPDAAVYVTFPHTLSQISAEPQTIRSGRIATGTVVLTSPAGVGGETILLSSSKRRVAGVPRKVTVPAGSIRADFNIRTRKVRRDASVTITATQGATTKSVDISITRRGT